MNMMLQEKREIYHEINTVVGNVNAVLFGSTQMAELPVSELVHCFGLNISVCNRSMEGLTVREAVDFVNDCVVELRPGKVFLGFGDSELQESSFQADVFFDEYRRLIRIVSERCRGKLFLVAPLMTGNDDFRTALKALAEETGCQYLDTGLCVTNERPLLSLFSLLSRYMRDGRLNFGDAMGMRFH